MYVFVSGIKYFPDLLPVSGIRIPVTSDVFRLVHCDHEKRTRRFKLEACPPAWRIPLREEYHLKIGEGHF